MNLLKSKKKKDVWLSNLSCKFRVRLLQCFIRKRQIVERISGAVFSACKTSERAKEQLQETIEIHDMKGWFPKGARDYLS